MAAVSRRVSCTMLCLIAMIGMQVASAAIAAPPPDSRNPPMFGISYSPSPPPDSRNPPLFGITYPPQGASPPPIPTPIDGPIEAWPYPPPTDAIAAPPPANYPPDIGPALANSPPPPRKTRRCFSIYELVSRNKALSTLKSIIDKVPDAKKALQLKTTNWTLLAPNNQALKGMPKRNVKFNVTQWSDYLKLHVVNGTYNGYPAWNKVRDTGVKTISGKTLTYQLAIGDDFKTPVTYWYIDLTPSTLGSRTQRTQSIVLSFQSNKKSSFVSGCKGGLYVVTRAFTFK